MIDTHIPLFGLSSTKNYIFVAGGGGDKAYGKENGFIVIFKDSLTQETIKFYKTEDFIRSVSVCSESSSLQMVGMGSDVVGIDSGGKGMGSGGKGMGPGGKGMGPGGKGMGPGGKGNDSDGKNAGNQLPEEKNTRNKNNALPDGASLSFSNSDAPSLSSSNIDGSSFLEHNESFTDHNNESFTEHSTSSQDDNNKESITDSPKESITDSPKESITDSPKETITDSAKESTANSAKESTANSTKETITDSTKESVLIAGAGEKYLYLLKFDGNFKLLTKIEGNVSNITLDKYFFFLFKNRVYGFYDLACINILREENKKKETEEEFVYKVYKRKGELVYKKECGTGDVTENWDGYFVYGDKIHKIIHQNEHSTFVFKNNKYKYKGRIPKIVVRGEELIFYVLVESKSILYILGDKETAFELPKITAMCVENEWIIVATCEGNVLLYKEKRFYSNKHLTDYPITGISIDKDQIYYSIITGKVLWTKMKPKNYLLWFALAVVTMIAAMVLAYYKRS